MNTRVFFKKVSLILLTVLFQINMLATTINATSGSFSLNQSQYLDNMYQDWVIESGQNFPLLISYEVDIEGSCDFVYIYAIDNYDNLQLIKTVTGSDAGVCSTQLPTGRALVVFETDGSVCGADGDYQGFTINFGLENQQNDTHIINRLYVKENSFVNGSSSVIGNLSIGKLHDGSSSVDIYNNKNQFGLYVYSNKTWTSDTYGIYSHTLNGTGSSSGNVYGLYSSVAGSTGKKWAGYFTGGNVAVMSGNIGIGLATPLNVLEISKTPDPNKVHLLFGNPTATSGQASSMMCFTGNGIQHAGLAWVPSSVANLGKLHLSFGGNANPMSNPIKVTFQNDGNVGIGTTAPAYKLEVAGSAKINNSLIVAGTGPDIGGAVSISNASKNQAGQASTWTIYNMSGTYGNSLQFWAYDNVGCASGGLCSNRFTITDDGKVGIGTSVIPSDYKLAVTGKIIVEEVVVKLQSNWPDYVFKSNYSLMPLHQVEQFVTTNNHLPGIPSATEVQNDGISMGEMQNKLLQKIEELTLYIIEQQKQIDELKKQVVK